MHDDFGAWHEYRLGDLVEIFDGPHATPKKTEVGPIFLGVSSLVNGRLDLTQTEHLSEESYVQWTRRVIPQEDDIVFSYETRIGEAAPIPEGLRCCLGRRMGLLRVRSNEVEVDPRFLLYAYLGPQFQDTLRQRTVHGSTVDRIMLKDLPDFPIYLPSLPEQRAIAHILGTLDDKIELNRQMNQTLEQIAAAHFKSWFVDFDPVRAKAAGRQPEGMDAATAALFPHDFVDDSVPQGWTSGVFTDIVNVLSGGTPSTREPGYWGGDIPWYSVVDAPSLSDVWVIDTERKITELGLQNSAAQLLPVGTTVISARGTVGKLALTAGLMTINQSCYGLVAKNGEPPIFTYYSTSRLVRELQQRSHGSVFDTITRSTLGSVEVTIPPLEVMTAFEQLAEPILLRVLNNLRQNQTLAALRDTLLPHLLSGELRVPIDVLEEEAVTMQPPSDELLVQSHL